MAQIDEQTIQLIEEAAEWAADRMDLHTRVKPIAEHFAELANAMTIEVVIGMAKAFEAGLYFGKHGFPEDRIPDVFEDAFKDTI